MLHVSKQDYVKSKRLARNTGLTRGVNCVRNRKRNGSASSFEMTILTFDGSQIKLVRNFLERKGRFPRWESALPKQDWRHVEAHKNSKSRAGRSTKIRRFCGGISTKDWPAACTIKKSWTHSDRRLSQVCERGGRGLLKDECWSFPPASEREARMDDPTPRSRKRRPGNGMRLLGLSSQARAPLFFALVLALPPR